MEHTALTVRLPATVSASKVRAPAGRMATANVCQTCGRVQRRLRALALPADTTSPAQHSGLRGQPARGRHRCRRASAGHRRNPEPGGGNGPGPRAGRGGGGAGARAGGEDPRAHDGGRAGEQDHAGRGQQQRDRPPAARRGGGFRPRRAGPGRDAERGRGHRLPGVRRGGVRRGGVRRGVRRGGAGAGRTGGARRAGEFGFAGGAEADGELGCARGAGDMTGVAAHGADRLTAGDGRPGSADLPGGAGRADLPGCTDLRSAPAYRSGPAYRSAPSPPGRTAGDPARRAAPGYPP